ncbi:MAG: UDP-N-acetylmuramoyl-L-alanine--D-glutamate ligase [Pseudomonadales bacterium]
MAKRRTLIIGLGITGLSCVRYLAGRDELVVVDTRSEPPGIGELARLYPDVPVTVGATRLDLEAVDRIVVSPGVALDSPLLEDIPQGVSLVSDVDLFCEAARAPIVAVTGTNGKSTVTSLVGHLLGGAGLRAVVGGNLGEAALDLLEREADVYVLELSSFQLERMSTHRFAVAAILNVTEDHLDRHGDMSSYVAAKQRIYRDCGLAVAHRNEAATYPPESCTFTTFGLDAPEAGHWGIRMQQGERWLVMGEEPITPADRLPLAGAHNELNVLAAMAMAHALGATSSQMAEAVGSFVGLPHRCQRVAQINGVDYIDDSKATNVGATEAALIGLGSTLTGGGPRIVLIAGGDGKGADFRTLTEVVRRFVKALVLLGRDAPAMAAALGEQTQTHRVHDMDEAVGLAARLAAPGDLVLLAPACASLDMYPNFAARGDHFSRAVEALAA